jgi:hypothetical protein
LPSGEIVDQEKPSFKETIELTDMPTEKAQIDIGCYFNGFTILFCRGDIFRNLFLVCYYFNSFLKCCSNFLWRYSNVYLSLLPETKLSVKEETEEYMEEHDIPVPSEETIVIERETIQLSETAEETEIVTQSSALVPFPQVGSLQ